MPRVRAWLRQHRHHRAFRIAPIEQDAVWQRLRELLAQLPDTTGDTATGGPDAAAPDTANGVDEKAIAESATNLWRAQRRLARDDGDDDSARKARQAGRYLRTCYDALVEAGLRTEDHDGTPFHPGLSLEALAFEERQALRAETVLETVRPTVYWNGKRIQMGQVIVGVPASEQETTDQETAGR